MHHVSLKLALVLAVRPRENALAVLHVVDPLELALPNVGLIELEDAETGQIGLFDTSDKRVREHFHKRALHMKQSTRETLRRAGIDEVEISTTGSCADPLMRYFRRRERRR